MGFNKRYVTKESLMRVYETEGMKGVDDYLTRPDALIIESDAFEIAEANSSQEVEQVLKKWINDRENTKHN